MAAEFENSTDLPIKTTIGHVQS